MNQIATEQLVSTRQIDGSVETIFDLLADMPNYNRWLSSSDSFAGTTQVTPYPVRLGTTYLEAGPESEKRGSVTEFDRPTHLDFRHSMVLRKGFVSASIEADIRYTLEPLGSGTSVVRKVDLTIQLPNLMNLVKPIVVAAFRAESERHEH